MSYWKSTSKNSRTLDSFSLSTNHTSNDDSSLSEFYEMEIGLVLDIVLDDKHPIFTKGEKFHNTIDSDRWPVDVSNNTPLKTDIDYSWIGRALIRPLMTEKLTDKDQLPWAYPLDNNLSEYPLINETVILISQGGKLYYTRKLNYHNWPNNNLDFTINSLVSGQSNTELYSKDSYVGRKESILKAPSKEMLQKNTGYYGYAGKYFVANNRIRTVRRYEGDLLIESRHGQTIHMTAYDSNRNNDVGDPKNKDYQDGGNPMILIRNRQRSILKEGQTLSLHNSPNPSTVTGTKQEKNVGGYIEENINHDGSSIHITTGQTISGWVTTCYKKMFGTGEEVSKFTGISSFKYPVLNGDQIVINSDRIILSARYGEMFSYSKNRYAIVTDNEYTVDAHQQIVLTTNTKTVINSPAIYLGEYDKTDEPVLLGQTTVNLLWDFLEMFKAHVHKHEHSHVDAGAPSPHMTQEPTNPFIQQATALQVRLKSLLSRRVFVTGGGFASGQNGASITDGTPPTQINVGSGVGVPGGFKGQSNRVS